VILLANTIKQLERKIFSPPEPGLWELESIAATETKGGHDHV